MIRRLVARLMSLFRPRPDTSNVDLVESLRAEMEFRQDKLRRENAIDAALDRAHRAALEDQKAYRDRMTAYTRKAGRLRSMK